MSIKKSVMLIVLLTLLITAISLSGCSGGSGSGSNGSGNSGGNNGGVQTKELTIYSEPNWDGACWWDGFGSNAKNATVGADFDIQDKPENIYDWTGFFSFNVTESKNPDLKSIKIQKAELKLFSHHKTGEPEKLGNLIIENFTFDIPKLNELREWQLYLELEKFYKSPGTRLNNTISSIPAPDPNDSSNIRCWYVVDITQFLGEKLQKASYNRIQFRVYRENHFDTRDNHKGQKSCEQICTAEADNEQFRPQVVITYTE